MKKSLLICILLMSLSLCFANVYKLTDLVNHAIQNSSTMRKSNTNLENVKDSHSQYLFDILPNATYNASYNHPSSIDYYSSFNIGKSISLNEPVYFNIRRSSLDKKIAELNHQNQMKKVAYDVLNAYIDIIQTQKNIEISQKNIDLQRRIYNQVMIQFQNDRKTIYDIQQSQVDTLDSYIALKDLKNSYRKQRENLFFMINMEDEGFPLDSYEFEIIEQSAEFEDNLSIQANQLSLKRSKLSLTQQYLDLFPNLSLNYNWQTSTNDNSMPELFDVDNYKDSYTFSVNLSYPLFNFSDTGFSYRIAKRNITTDKIDLEDTINETKKNLNQTILDWEMIYQTYSLYEQKHQLTQANLDIAEERFALGLISSLDLDKARIQYLESEVQLVNRYYTLIKKQEEINYLKSNKLLGLW